MSQKVLLIAPQPFFAVRGTPMNVRAVAETLTKEGYDVHLLAYPFGEEIKIPGVTILRCCGVPGVRTVPVGASWQKLLLDVPLSISALITSLRHRYDAYHGIEEGGFIAGTLGLLHRKPFIYDMDSCMIDQLRSSKLKRQSWLINTVAALERFFLKKAHAVLTVATPLTEKVAQIAPHAKIFQIEDFPLEGAASSDPSQEEDLRRRYVGDASEILLYTGNFEHYQGVELALNAWKLAHEGYGERMKSARFILVGGTEQQIARYRSLCDTLSISSSVHFPGSQPPEAMGSFQALATAVISPRIVGGNTPLKIFTYMASNLPIIATKIDAHTSVLSDETAFLAQATARDLSSAIFAGLYNPEGTEKALKAKMLVENRYSRINFEEKLGRLYQHIMPKSLELKDDAAAAVISTD